jgi:PAS domain S-box-containing protein
MSAMSVRSSSIPPGFFDALFINSKLNAIIIMDANGRIITVNDAFTDCFDYQQHEVAGQHFSMLFTSADRADHLPEKEIARAKAGGQASDKNYLVAKNGQQIWVTGETVLVDNEEGAPYLLKVIQDINDQKASELSLARSNNFNESILTSIEDVVIVLDEHMNIMKANPAFNRLFKYERVEKALAGFRDFIRPYDIHDQLAGKIHGVITTREPFTDMQMEIKTPLGDRVFDISCRPMHIDNNPAAVLLVVHDITLQKQAEREREDIIGFVAHELRNPLANIILCNELMTVMLRDNNIAGMHNLLERSRNNIFRLNKMIAELYDATNVNSGNFTLEITGFDFDNMVAEAIDTVHILQPVYNIVVQGKADSGIRGDRYRLIQVVTNYLSNGIKYSNGQKDVLIDIKKENGHIIFSVKDNGIGISPDQLPFIFERFFRAEKTRNMEGMGLGLFLCRRIIEEHDGRVWAESEEGKGSVFYFSIPVQ